ncbi:MAG TPA: hypothetical protein VD997_16555 [Phycisphaerales bacterium]|nr:hypothetical protein [Phycisphaerales bacterium]
MSWKTRRGMGRGWGFGLGAELGVDAGAAPAMEQLEARALLAAVTATVTGAGTDVGSLFFNVRYASDRPIDVSTINGDEIRVVRNLGGFDEQAELVSLVGTGVNSAVARYRVLAPASHGQWRFITDDGHYTIKLNEGTVENDAGETNAAADVRTLSLWFGAPVLDVANENRLDVYGMGYTGLPDSSGRVSVSDQGWVDVRYQVRSLAKLPRAFVARLTGPNGYDQTVTVTPIVSQFTALPGGGYEAVIPVKFAVPGVTWDTSDAGAYTLTVRMAPLPPPNQWTQPVQQPVLVTREFDVQARGVTAEIARVSVTTGEMLVTVRYSHPSGIDLASIGTGDVKVAMGGTLASGTLVGTPEVVHGVVTAVYRVAEPASGWASVAGGNATIRTGLQEVRATNGETIGFALTRTVRVASGGRVEGVVKSAYTTATKLVVVMRYFSDSAIDVSTLGDDDLRLTGPWDYSVHGDLVQVLPQSNGEVLAVYHFAPNSDNGQWDFRVSNGRYDLFLEPGSISEVGGDGVRDGFVRYFGMYFQNPVVTWVNEPFVSTGTAAAGTTFIELDSLKFTLRYATPYERNNRSNALVLKVKGPDGQELDSYKDYWTGPYRGFVRSTQDDILFEFVPPGGGWDYTDNGTYTVEVYLAPVEGNPVLQLITTRQLEVTASAPRARVVSTTVGYDSLVATVRYDGLGGISVASLGDNDIGVVLANTYNSSFPFNYFFYLRGSTLVGSPIVESDGSVVATYRIAHVDPFTGVRGPWDRTWNLSSVYVQPGQVTDTQGRVVGTTRLANIVIAPPPPVVNTVGTLSVARNAWVVEVALNNIGGLVQGSSITASSLVVAAPNGASTRVFVDSVLTALDGTIRVRYRIAPMSVQGALPNGNYTLSLAANSVSMGAAGYLPAATLGTFSNMVFS